ncbi:helix-turn-helix domain-containing protein [Yinghuangia sp. YIM S09857]|uniref:helix-turn-helix domain-containing protein n=1 Tax=Yinghuangia sp. YIM S09857 TaxID=3436929 RepID=UPI003F53045C
MAVVPTYARRELGKELQRLREAAGFTQARTAKTCSWSNTKVIRLEGGNVTLTLHDLHVLADLYKATEDQREHLIELMERTEEGQWWQSYGRLVPTVLDEFLALESQASRIQAANMATFPGLLQSPGYAQAVFGASAQVPDPDDVEALVELRMRRRRVLDGGTQLHAVLSEALLLTPLGGVDILHQQLAHLLEAGHQPNVTLQLVPLTTESVIMIGGLLLFEFDANATSVAYTEHAGGLNAYHRAHEVRRYKRDIDYVKSHALSPEETLVRIQARLREL